MKAIVPCCLILMLAGCATVRDLRSQPSDQSMESTLPPQQIANCVQHQAPAKVSNAAVPYYHFTLNEEPKGTFHILAEIPGQPMGEADFRPSATGTHIDFRSRWNFWGSNAFWNCIQQCASPH